MASDDVQLLLVWASPYAMRAELALYAKGVPYSKLPQDLFNKSHLLLQSNPVHKKIPVLLHHGKPVCESTIIVEYVDEAFPSSDGNDLLPKDAYDRAIARFWADFVDKKIFDTLRRAMLSTGQEQKAAIKEAKEYVGILEEAFGTVPKEPPFFGGANVGYVDIILAPLVAWYEAYETTSDFKFEFEKLPRLAAWMKAMRECPLGQQLPTPSTVTKFVLELLQTLAARAAAA